MRRKAAVKRYWELVADNLSKAGWSWGCVATVDERGRTIFVADAHRGDGQRFVVHADEKVCIPRDYRHSLPSDAAIAARRPQRTLVKLSHERSRQRSPGFERIRS